MFFVQRVSSCVTIGHFRRVYHPRLYRGSPEVVSIGWGPKRELLSLPLLLLRGLVLLLHLQEDHTQ